MFAETNSLATETRSSASIRYLRIIYTLGINLYVIVILKWVLMRPREENVHSAVALVTGGRYEIQVKEFINLTEHTLDQAVVI